VGTSEARDWQLFADRARHFHGGPATIRLNKVRYSLPRISHADGPPMQSVRLTISRLALSRMILILYTFHNSSSSIERTCSRRDNYVKSKSDRLRSAAFPRDHQPFNCDRTRDKRSRNRQLQFYLSKITWKNSPADSGSYRKRALKADDLIGNMS
jgi:hypothetical protein